MTQLKYDLIGSGYNSTRQADPYLVSRLIHHLQPDKEKLYLDIGCGTGNYTLALAEKGFTLYGVEPSEKMLNEATKRSDKVQWLSGTAENIPAKDQMFAGIIATLTIHHWTNLNKAFSELNRVLLEKGKIVLFTSTPEQMKGYWLNNYFPKMLEASIIQMPSLENIIRAATYAGLEVTNTEKYFIQDDLQDHFLYAGKNRPELYLNAQIRSGISSFTALANADEVETGLQKLKTDLENSSFERVKQNYSNDLGDYIFITIEKKVRV